MHLDVSRTLKSIGDFPFSLFDYLQFDALLDAPYRVLGALETLHDHLARGTILPRRVEGTVMSHALLALVVAASRTAARLDGLGLERSRKFIENGVTTGNPYDDSLLRVASLADALIRDQIDQVHRLYTAAGAKRLPYDVASVRDAVAQTPAWLDRFMDFAARLRARSPIARELPQVVQLACFDALMGDENWRAPAFDHLFTLEHRQLLNVAVETLGAVVGSSLEVLAGLRSLDFERGGTALRDRSEVFTPPSPKREGSPAQEELFQAREEMGRRS
jgi:hypothetical protein